MNTFIVIFSEAIELLYDGHCEERARVVYILVVKSLVGFLTGL